MSNNNPGLYAHGGFVPRGYSSGLGIYPLQSPAYTIPEPTPNLTVEGPILAWHFLPSSRKTAHGEGIEVSAGTKLHIAPPVIPCSRGYHASEKALDALMYADPFTVVCRVKLDGTIVRQDDKYAASDRECLWISEGEIALMNAAQVFGAELLSSGPMTEGRLRLIRGILDQVATGRELHNYSSAYAVERMSMPLLDDGGISSYPLDDTRVGRGICLLVEVLRADELIHRKSYFAPIGHVLSAIKRATYRFPDPVSTAYKPPVKREPEFDRFNSILTTELWKLAPEGYRED